MFRRVNLLLCSNRHAHIGSRRDAKTAAVQRRPELPRAGTLEAAHLIGYGNHNNSITTDPHPNPAPKRHGDTTHAHTGHLDYWRDAIHTRITQHASCRTVASGGLRPAWDVVVPLLEGLRDFAEDAPIATRRRNDSHLTGRGAAHLRTLSSNARGGGRVIKFERATANTHDYRRHMAVDPAVLTASSFSTRAREAGDELSNENFIKFAGLPSGSRVSSEALSRQFQVELLVRLPLLEQSLFTTCSPMLLGRLCSLMFFSGVPRLPADEGAASTSRRLRSLFVDAFGVCEEQMAAAAEAEGQKEESELRNLRRLSLESATSSSIAEFAETNSDLFSSSTTAAAEEKYPQLLTWAKKGKMFLKE